MEKRRRARINNCLNELKALILDAMKKDVSATKNLYISVIYYYLDLFYYFMCQCRQFYYCNNNICVYMYVRRLEILIQECPFFLGVYEGLSNIIYI